MAYDIAPDSVMQVQFEGRLFGQQVMTVMTYRMTGALTLDGTTTLNEINTALIAAGGLWDKWLGCMSQDVQSCYRSLQWIKPIRYAYLSYLDTPLAQGLLVNDSLPPNDSQALTRRTEIAGRKETSTLKLPGLPAVEVTAGFISEDQITRLQDFGDQSCLVIPVGGGNEMKAIPFSPSGWAERNVLTTSYPHNTSRIMRRRTVGLGS